MIIKKIRLHNFMCFADTSCTFPNARIANIYGLDIDRNTSNGVGKSALKEAILFALFGRTKVSLSDVVRKGCSGCEVELVCEVGKKDVRVIRSFKRSSSVEVFVDGNKLKFSGVREKQKALEELIGFDYDTFVNFSIFDAVRFEDLSSLSATEIKRLMQLLFNYSAFDNAYNMLKQRASSYQTIRQQLQNRKTHYYSYKRLQILQQGLQKLYSYYNNLQRKIDILHQLKYKLVEDISSNKSTIAKNQRLINWILSKTECPTCKRPLDNKTFILNSFQSEINQCYHQIQRIQSRLQRVDLYLNRWTQENTALTTRIANVNRLIATLTTLKQTIQNIDDIEKQIMTFQKSMEVLQQFEAYVMNYYVIHLERVINNYLSKLTDVRCKLSFVKQGSLITRNIGKCYMSLYRGDHQFSYMSLSSGERMLVAYAFKMAINTLTFRDTFLFIDEGLSRLDKSNRQKLIQLLQQSPFKQIFLISHDSQIEGIPTIFLTKQDDTSTISVGI